VASPPTTDITSARLRFQRLSGDRFVRPEDVVSWLGAVQAQEYVDAKWALGLRMRRPNDAAIERALATGTILRTHVLRPTWHFVARTDIRWMLALTGPRVSRRMAPYNRHLELDAAVFRRSQAAMVRALRDGAQLTRQELKVVLQRAGVRADGVQRLAHIVMQAELDAVICSGARRGKHHTYALLDERVPVSPPVSREEALHELVRRYFTSHGPAQLRDFVWWSGLTAGDARAGVAMADGALGYDTVNGKTYWFPASLRALRPTATAFLLPLYDEYLIAYKDRSAAFDRSRWISDAPRDPFRAPVVVNGQVIGGWRRTMERNRVVFTMTPFMQLRRSDVRTIADAANRYARFLGLPLALSWKVPNAVAQRVVTR
jgi:hypothetical protein